MSLILLLFLACAACSPSYYSFKGTLPRYETADGELLYRYSVDNPKLSEDGRYMAFDFHQFTRDGKRTIRTLLAIGIYDIQKQSIEIFNPPFSKEQWHSPSFDSTGKKLTFVAVCAYRECPEHKKRSHIMIMDLDDKKVVQISNSEQMVGTFGYNYATGIPYHRKGEWSQSIVRGEPVFSMDGRRIYYQSGYSSMSNVFWLQFDPEYRLSVLDLNGRSEKFVATDELVQNKDQDAIIYKGDGRIAVLENEKLIFNGWDVTGKSFKALDQRQPTAFFYDLAKDELTIAIDKFNTPPDPRTPAGRTQLIESLTASHDGRLIAAIRGWNFDILTLWEDGRPRDILTAKELNLERIGYISLSGNGRWLAIMPSHLPPRAATPPDIDHFWILDLTTGELKSLPLRRILRDAVNRNRSNDALATRLVQSTNN